MEDWLKVTIEDNNDVEKLKIENEDLKKRNNFLKLRIKKMKTEMKRVKSDSKLKDKKITELSEECKYKYNCVKCKNNILKTKKEGVEINLDKDKYTILEVEDDNELNYGIRKSYILKDVVSIKEVFCSNCFIILGFKVVEVYNKWDYFYKNKIFLNCKDNYLSP